jgi:CBS domain containing-hemolysin-like protein
MTPEEIKILLFALCLLLSAFFSGSEVALISITKAKVRMLLAAGDKRAVALAALKKNPDHILITILIGNNIVNVAASALATSIAIDRFGDVGLGYATGVVVLLLLVFGEIGPKMYGVRFTDRFALTVARPIHLLTKAFSPILWVFDRLSHSSNLTAAFAKPAITEEEIKGWIDLGKEAGTIEQEEREMLYSVLEFGDTTAREVMTPRIDVVMVEEKSTIDHAINLFNESGFSRLPVYHEQVDNIIGILNVKDLFPTAFGRKNLAIRDLMHEPFFAPESKKIDDLLKELQVRKIHMAIVLDEYGSFAGIVTVEDILEELVGEILDEYDKEEPEVQKAEDGTYLIDARAWVEDINDQLGLALPVHEAYETMGGLIIERLGHIPHKGEKVELTESGVVLQIVQMRAKRVERLKLLPVPGHNGE